MVQGSVANDEAEKTEARHNIQLLDALYSKADSDLISLEREVGDGHFDGSTLCHYTQIEDVQKQFNNTLYAMPTYDVQRYQTNISKLRYRLRDCERKRNPRKKFQFNCREKLIKKREGSDIVRDSVVGKEDTTLEGGKPTRTNNTFKRDKLFLYMNIYDGKDEQTSKKSSSSSSAVSGSSSSSCEYAQVREDGTVVLSDTQNSVIVIGGRVKALHAIKLSNCFVIASPVEGSCLIRECTSSSFTLAGQQMRIHDTYDCEFYINVKGDPIIEDCNGLLFAPYNAISMLLQFEREWGVLPVNESDDNRWNCVKDFGWLKSTPSPHWRSIPREKQLVYIHHSPKTSSKDDKGSDAGAAHLLVMSQEDFNKKLGSTKKEGEHIAKAQLSKDVINIFSNFFCNVKRGQSGVECQGSAEEGDKKDVVKNRNMFLTKLRRRQLPLLVDLSVYGHAENDE